MTGSGEKFAETPAHYVVPRRSFRRAQSSISDNCARPSGYCPGVSIKCGSTFWENWDNARRGCKRRALVGGG
jgi:hypothetical protein